MLAPLKTMYVTGPFGERAVPGTGLPDSSGVKRHIGVDLRASVNTPVYAMESGTVTIVDNVGLRLVEIRGTKTIRYLHLERNILGTGQKVSAGKLIGYSGDTGGVLAHLHVDVRNNGTAYNQSFYNYYNPMALINETTQGQIMDTDEKIRNQYYTLRGAYPSSSEVKSWRGQSYEKFNSVAKAEVNSRTAGISNLKSAVATLTQERDKARTAVSTLTTEVLGLRDQVKVLEATNKTKDSEIQGLQDSLKDREAECTQQIKEYEEIVKVKDEEIVRLTKELETSGTDCDKLSAWQLIAMGIRKLIGAK
jgi:septal ring factor EnvC (AmiA/AmiB activator)